MVSRRTFFKSLGIVATGATVLNAPTLHAEDVTFASSYFSNKKRIALIGSSEQAQLLVDFIHQYPNRFDLIMPENTQCFSSVEQLMQSGQIADLVFISGIRKCETAVMEALNNGCMVWVDRLPVYEPHQCAKINAIAAGNFCKVNIMYMIDGSPYLMPNKAVIVDC